jgi:hypothetical protein
MKLMPTVETVLISTAQRPADVCQIYRAVVLAGLAE